MDIQPLLRMALLYPRDHITHRALIHTAQVIENREGAHRSADLRILAEHLAAGTLIGRDIVLAADAADTHADEFARDIDPAIARPGWQEVLNRADRLAEQCVHTLIDWSSGDVLPWAYGISIPAETASGAEFLARLEPAPHRTAIYAVLDPTGRATPMVDPLTNAPVAYAEGSEDKIRALAPERVPATSPLAALVLDIAAWRTGCVWVRTADGGLYPAPHDHYAGLSWGNSGTGPDLLAALANALLDDITAPSVKIGDPAPAGLVQLFRRPWPAGTTLTRDQLEQARHA